MKVNIKRYLDNSYNPATNGGINAMTGKASKVSDSDLPNNIWYPKSDELKNI